MIKRGQYYLRYVDDIRILAPDRNTASRALLDLDVAFKKQALILQPAKTGAREISDINKEIDELAGTLSMIDNEKRRGENVDEEAEAIFFKSWHTLEQDNHAEAHLIFALHRIPTTRPARNIALNMLHAMPWRSDRVTNYLGKFSSDQEVINALMDEVITHRVYAWHLANCIRTVSKIANVSIYRNICREWIADKKLRWYQRLAAVESLQHDAESFSFLLLQYEQEPHYLVRSALLVAAAFSASNDASRATIIRKGLRDTHHQVIATSIWLFLEFPKCGINLNEFSPELGVHRKMIPAFSGSDVPIPCYIEKNFKELFRVDVPQGLDFRAVFSTVYDDAVDHIRQAVRYKDTDPTIFITRIDNFNQICAIKISETIDGKSIPKSEYGNIINALKASHSIIAVHFLECHELRSRSKGTHAWATSLGNWSQDVTHHQKDQIIRNLGTAYQMFANTFATYQGIVTI